MFARALVFFTAVSTGTSYMLAPGAAPCSARARTAASAMQFGGQQAEELEFIIHADGRVEERVRGIKGGNCQSITAAIEEALGEVYESKATEEMFEQEVELSVSDEVGQEVTADWKGTSEW